jgi:hypothetical protein
MRYSKGVTNDHLFFLLNTIIVEICCSVFQHDSYYLHTSKNVPGFDQMKEAKVSFGDVWLDTPCRIHSWCQPKADPVKGLKMSVCSLPMSSRSQKVLELPG